MTNNSTAAWPSRHRDQTAYLGRKMLTKTWPKRGSSPASINLFARGDDPNIAKGNGVAVVLQLEGAILGAFL